MLNRPLKVLIGVFVILVMLVMVAGVVLSSGKQLGNRHAPADFAEVFDYTGGTFADYRAYSERRIRASRMDEPSDEEVERLLPFLLEPDADCPVNTDGDYLNGIVLVHGLIASPWSMKAMGEYFQSHCFLVLGVLLPGHGTRPGDMLISTWEDWRRDVDFATKLVADRVERLYLSGHSAGGTLSVLEATRNPDVNALVLFAPAMGITGASKYAGAVSQLGKIFPGAAWFEAEPDDAVYRYESFPFKAAAETWELIQATQNELLSHPLDIPVMTVASAQDATVEVQATFDFMAQQTNPLSHTLLYAQHDLPPYYRTRVVDSNDPDNGILSVGHLGLMTPPDHPWYGRDGSYRYCSHYYGEEGDAYARCKAGQRDFYGETTEENLGYGLIERIAFNPFYDDLLDEIDLFIEQVSMDRRGFPPSDRTIPDPLDIE